MTNVSTDLKTHHYTECGQQNDANGSQLSKWKIVHCINNILYCQSNFNDIWNY